MEDSGKETLIGKAWLNGRLQYSTNADQSGEASGYYENGSVWFRYPLLDGEVHGTGRLWYPDGTLQSEEHYQKGVLHGPAHYWHPNGTLRREVHYRRGLLHGTNRRWYPSGILHLQCVNVEGRLNGLCLDWYPDGTLRTRSNYANRQLHGILERYGTDGKLTGKELYVRGVRVPSKTYQRFLSGELFAKEILEIRNVEVRRILVEEFGYARILAQMPHEVTDKDAEQELIRINWGVRQEPICLVKVKCPSTGAFYALRVPPAMKTVKEAVAWTFGLKAGDYFPSRET